MRFAIQPKLNRFKRTATTATFAIMIMTTAVAAAFSTVIVSAAALVIRRIVPATATAFVIFVVMGMATAATASATTTGMRILGAMTLAAAAATAVPLTSAATRLLLIFEEKRAAFELGNRLCNRCRIGSKSPDTALRQSHFGRTIDAATKNGINPETLAGTAALIAQGNMHVLAGIGIEKHQVLGMRQMRLNRRLGTVRGCYGNTEFHFLAFQKQ